MKNVLITGGSRGIGRAMVYKFARNGYRVLLNYNTSEDAAKKIANELTNVEIFKADVSNREEVDTMYQYAKTTMGTIDVLINNAGIANYNLFQDVSEEDWQRLIGVNLTGVFHCTQAFLPDMIHKKSGNILNISSVCGITGSANEVIYSTTKAGIIGMTKGLAKELGPSNINVNCIAPGSIMTDMISNLSMEEFKQLSEEIPLGRIGCTEDVANVAYFLASDEANYITGQVISPNGGWVI